jgi:hypothetical protein
MPDEMTMVERVARALSVADGMHPQAASNDADEQPAWTLYVGMAKAAIESLREPTEAMVEAGSGASTSGDEGVFRILVDRQCAGEAWSLMIDAALKEPTNA